MLRNFQSRVVPAEPVEGPAYWFIFRRYHLLTRRHGERRVTVPYVREPAQLGLDPVRVQYLGLYNGEHVFSAEVNEESAAPEGMGFQNLRRLYFAIDEDFFWLAARAVQVVAWDRDHQFCGRCATPTEMREQERARVCPDCGLSFYPRLSPAVIMAVIRDDRILLAHGRRHPEGLYSVLAGFVEPGETLEDAVRREVKEEVGLDVGNIRYFGSQPWPFPSSLMLAFTCEYKGGEIVLEDEEIADAGWYRAGELPQTPPSMSIAASLIAWFEGENR